MKILAFMSGAALLAATAILSPLSAQDAFAPPPPNLAACAPENGLKFICGVRAAEDETLIPGTRWIITSGKLPGEGVKLVDTDAKTEQLLYTGTSAQIRAGQEALSELPGAAGP